MPEETVLCDGCAKARPLSRMKFVAGKYLCRMCLVRYYVRTGR